MKRRWNDFLVDSAFALSVFGWGVVGVCRNRVSDGISLPLISILVLNVIVCLQLARRDAPSSQASFADALQVLPSILLGPLLLFRAGEFSEWSTLRAMLFSAATLFAGYALMTLSTSFAVFPSIRELVARGPYRWVRHPAYAGQLGMALLCVMLKIDAVGLLLACALVAATIWRVVVEERFLASMSGYEAYCEQVRWRLIPLVW